MSLVCLGRCLTGAIWCAAVSQGAQQNSLWWNFSLRLTGESRGVLLGSSVWWMLTELVPEVLNVVNVFFEDKGKSTGVYIPYLSILILYAYKKFYGWLGRKCILMFGSSLSKVRLQTFSLRAAQFKQCDCAPMPWARRVWNRRHLSGTADAFIDVHSDKYKLILSLQMMPKTYFLHNLQGTFLFFASCFVVILISFFLFKAVDGSKSLFCLN